jgi:geranylgeranyl reductase family protein
MTYDVIIVGAGPAGSTCASVCARAGLHVLLLDRESFPRQKPCGGALSAQALSLLPFPLPPEIIERECFGVRVRYGSETVAVRRDERIAVLVDRAALDHFLARKAVEQGCRFLDGQQATDIIPRGETIEVCTAGASYRGRFVVGADGAAGITARLVRPALGRDEMLTALVCHVAADQHSISTRLDGDLDMVFGVAPQGYGWVFPHRNSYSVGVMGLASRFEGPQRRAAAFARSVGLPATAFRGHVIPVGGIPRRITSGRLLLAGDAAGCADPFHGEGMVHAIRSGGLAGDAVIRGLRGQRDALTWYERECGRLIMRQMRVALQMARMLERYPRVFRELFFTDTRALDRFLDIPLGRSDYVRFRRWLLLRLPRALAAQFLPERSG